ncbi:hypothetical protein [Variovorax sp. RA8]|uniref:hypothetical protein n=1 Tax=Variovorax sp. (strain JCM 16519 / RA8) TaxID=662548 RepID=UPI000A8F1193|nr:hypothetical protein [Variovorax sp. RA8]VTU30932.1 hypothetical protein RA8CHR_04257 [Variovorax sp. RA8]
MAENSRILAHVLIEMNPLASQSAGATKAALRSAIQVGLNAQVLELSVYPIAAEDGARPVQTIPHSEPSDHDQVVEEYVHSGMQVRIYRHAGRKSPPSHNAVVLNPSVKNPSGAFIEAKSYGELKQAAEARAERKAKVVERAWAIHPLRAESSNARYALKHPSPASTPTL